MDECLKMTPKLDFCAVFESFQRLEYLDKSTSTQKAMYYALKRKTLCFLVETSKSNENSLTFDRSKHFLQFLNVSMGMNIYRKIAKHSLITESCIRGIASSLFKKLFVLCSNKPGTAKVGAISKAQKARSFKN